MSMSIPGGLLHIDPRKLGRIERMSHRVTGNRRDTVGGAGWEYMFVGVDDHSRIGFTDMYPEGPEPSVVQFLQTPLPASNHWGCAYDGFHR